MQSKRDGNVRDTSNDNSSNLNWQQLPVKVMHKGNAGSQASGSSPCLSCTQNYVIKIVKNCWTNVNTRESWEIGQRRGRNRRSKVNLEKWKLSRSKIVSHFFLFCYDCWRRFFITFSTLFSYSLPASYFTVNRIKSLHKQNQIIIK